MIAEEELLQHDIQFRYMLLSRMQSDCQSYLDPVFPQNHLWAGNPTDQIKCMRILWKSFPKGEKPVWCTKSDIDKYAKAMGVS